MKSLTVAALAFGIMTTLIAPNANAQAKIEGVKGNLVLIEKKAANAGVLDKIQVPVGDKIEIAWTYPIVPGAIPNKVEAKSDSGAVKAIEVLSISQPRVLGVGNLGAFFVAEKVGKAKLMFVIKSAAEGQGVILEVEVEVVAQ